MEGTKLGKKVGESNVESERNCNWLWPGWITSRGSRVVRSYRSGRGQISMRRKGRA